MWLRASSDVPQITADQLDANWLPTEMLLLRESLDPSASKNNRRRCKTREPRRAWIVIPNGECDTKKCALPRVLKKSILDKKIFVVIEIHVRCGTAPLASRQPFLPERALFESLLHLSTFEFSSALVGVKFCELRMSAFSFAFAFSCIFSAQERERKRFAGWRQLKLVLLSWFQWILLAFNGSARVRRRDRKVRGLDR